MNTSCNTRCLRVLLLSPEAELGGAERMLLDLIASWGALMARGALEVHLLTLGDGMLVQRARALGATVHIVPVPASVAQLGESGGSSGTNRAALITRSLLALPSLFNVLRQLRQAIHSIAPQVVHSNGAKTHLLSRWSLPRTSGSARPILIWHVHDFFGRRPFLARWLRWFAGHTTVAVAVSEAVAADLRAVLPRTKVATVLNAVDVEHFSPGPAPLSITDRDQPCARCRAVRIGLVATYARWKGQDVFLRAIARMQAMDGDAPPIRFFIIGGPIYRTLGSQFSRAELLALADELKVRQRVQFIEFQADPADAYRGLDIVVHASTEPEPFGRTIVEAMACARAVIVSAGGGACELVRNGVDGLTVTPGDVSALAQAMGRLAMDAPMRARFAAAARESAARRFDRRRLGFEWLTLYRQHLPLGVRQAFGEAGGDCRPVGSIEDSPPPAGLDESPAAKLESP